MEDEAITENGGNVIVTGTYHVTGTSKSGEKIERKGSNVNTVVKQGGLGR